jgi:hypothetical protein
MKQDIAWHEDRLKTRRDTLRRMCEQFDIYKAAMEREIGKKVIEDFAELAPRVILALNSIANELDRRRANAKPRAKGEGGRT